MSTRACYRFVDPASSEVVTIYKHHDGYPEGAVCWITKALDYAWRLARFEADEFAAAFVAANKDSAQNKRREYLDRAERESDPTRKAALLQIADDWRPNGRYAAMNGGGVRIVNQPGLDAFKAFAPDIAYLYDVTVKDGALLINAFATDEQNGQWVIEPVFSGTLEEMQTQFGLHYLNAA
jgi:hypothetical protein